MDPNQMQQMQQTMTKQELKDTQVLNLNDVKQVAKAEKKASFPKKIAICLFVLGVLAIIGGFSYNTVVSMMGMTPNNNGKEKITEGKTESADTTKEATTAESSSTLSCSAEAKGRENGTDVNVIYELPFNESNQLLTYTKTQSIVPTTGNSTGPVTVNTLKDGYTTIAGYQIPGYTLQVTPTNNGTVSGLQVVLTIDLANLDQTKYASYNIQDPFSMVDLGLNSSREEVTQTLTTKGFTCK